MVNVGCLITILMVNVGCLITILTSLTLKNEVRSTKITMQTNVIKRIRTLCEEEKKFIPVELMVRDMNSLEQYAETVINYTSHYNISFSISYSPENLIGKYVKYPSYGDFAETYILRSYGKWWKESEGYQQEYMPQEVDPLGAEDYVTLGYEQAVVPRDVCIYETYNPGAVVRIWGRFANLKWNLLWEGPPQVCPEESRKFHPPIRQLNCLINEIRLEFNQTHLKYHTSLDAILLGGFQAKKCLQEHILQNDLLNWGGSETLPPLEEIYEIGGQDFFSQLPHEVIVHIFQYLDLKSLCMCSRVNKMWNYITQDPILYQNLSLKRYWHKINGANLNYFTKRCSNVRKLDLSWCGNGDKSFSNSLITFLENCCHQLTHLSLCHCTFENPNVLRKIAQCKELIELRIRNPKLNPSAFEHLSQLTKLVTLDLCQTHIQDAQLIKILKANPDLKRLLLDFCEGIERFDGVIEVVATYNTKITCWSSFKTTTLTPTGGLHFAKCANLRELDLGWCYLLVHPGDTLVQIAHNCRHLKRLIISQWRGVTDPMLLPVITYCKELRQLDLLGIKSITNDICERALTSLPNLRLLDLSFCDCVSNEKVAFWREEFPLVTIQRSCQYVVMDYLN